MPGIRPFAGQKKASPWLAFFVTGESAVFGRLLVFQEFLLQQRVGFFDFNLLVGGVLATAQSAVQMLKGMVEFDRCAFYCLIQ